MVSLPCNATWCNQQVDGVKRTSSYEDYMEEMGRKVGGYKYRYMGSK